MDTATDALHKTHFEETHSANTIYPPNPSRKSRSVQAV